VSHSEEQKTAPKTIPIFKYACPYCNYVSQQKKRLNTHLNKIHAKEYTTEKTEQPEPTDALTQLATLASLNM